MYLLQIVYKQQTQLFIYVSQGIVTQPIKGLQDIKLIEKYSN